MGSEEIDNRLKLELMEASMMFLDDASDIHSLLGSSSITSNLNQRVIDEIYSFLMSIFYGNMNVQNYIRRILSYSLIYDACLDYNIDVYKGGFSSLLEEFVRNEEFAKGAIKKYYTVFDKKDYYEAIFSRLGGDKKETLDNLLSDERVFTLTIRARIQNIIYGLFSSFIREGYARDEAISLVETYVEKDGISPIIVSEYIDYDLYLQNKDKIKKFILSDVYMYLVFKGIDPNLFQYLAFHQDMPEDPECRRKVYSLFILYMEEKDTLFYSSLNDKQKLLLERIPIIYRF